ncbi:MAG TPA: hypothetical protein VIJ16_09695 [Gemmatimonadaceae bacterium]
MSRSNNPGCVLSALSAAFGVIFLPIGVSLLFLFHHREWMRGVGAIASALGFFYVAWRANDILGLGDIPDTATFVMPDPPPPPRSPELRDELDGDHDHREPPS